MVSSFPITSDAVALEWLYTAIDMLLLFGLIGIYLARAERLGFLGLASFAIAVAALSFIGGPDADPFGFSTYEQGAAVLAIAMVGLSIAWLRAGERPLAPPLCWFGSVICVGVLNFIPPLSQYGFMLAGVLFGLGICACRNFDASAAGLAQDAPVRAAVRLFARPDLRRGCAPYNSRRSSAIRSPDARGASPGSIPGISTATISPSALRSTADTRPRTLPSSPRTSTPCADCGNCSATAKPGKPID